MSQAVTLLAPGGMLADLVPNYESRPAQVAMAETIEQAIEQREHAIVEAPTGVGKSFAYLLPAALHALQQKKKVVISTGTIALQEQLINKDIPLLQSLFSELNAVLIKGRQNYISLRRLAYAQSGQQALFENAAQAQTVEEIAEWAEQTTTGDKGDMAFEPDWAAWRHVQSDRNNCRGRRCEFYHKCFFYKAREELLHADLLVVNHHLYFSDLALRDDNAAILPAHDVVIFDEAHGLEDIATDHLGLQISAGQVRFFLDGLHNRHGKGLLANDRFTFARNAVAAAKTANDAFWQAVGTRFGNRREDTMRIPGPDFFANDLSPELLQVATQLRACQARSDDDNTSMECKAQADRATVLAGTLIALISHENDNQVYYATVPQAGRGSPSLSCNPLDVSTLLQELLFSKTPTVVLTSATLAADDSERFLFLRKRLGIQGGKACRLESPFDFTRQAQLLVNRSALDPNGPHFERATAQWLGDFLDDIDGGTFVLFTSYRQLQAVHDMIRPRLDRRNRFVLRQGEGIGRRQMLDLFRSVGNAVLFGTASFWEGVDVRGDALKNVVITKIPFEVPNHPLTEARHQLITARGGNPFMERSVPEAILRLKQGVGRLIRTKQDTGRIVILDHRILTKSYGRYFLRALPAMEQEEFELAQYLG